MVCVHNAIMSVSASLAYVLCEHGTCERVGKDAHNFECASSHVCVCLGIGL